MLIPYSELSAAALRGLISQYLLAHADESSDSADNDRYASAVLAALKRGELVISYSEEHESAAIRHISELTPEAKGDGN